MTGRLFEGVLGLASELIIQIVPPAILAAWAAWQIALHSSATFAEAAGVIVAGLLTCALFQAAQVK